MPPVPLATLKDPDIPPPETVHCGFEMSPVGFDVIVQLVSPMAKFDPWTRTFVPGSPAFGDNVIPGVTLNVAVPKSPKLPVTVIVEVPGTAESATWNEPVQVPGVVSKQVAPDAIVSLTVNVASVGRKPVAMIVTAAPRGPEVGVRVTTRGTTFSVVDADAPVLSVRVSL